MKLDITAHQMDKVAGLWGNKWHFIWALMETKCLRVSIHGWMAVALFLTEWRASSDRLLFPPHGHLAFWTCRTFGLHCPRPYFFRSVNFLWEPPGRERKCPSSHLLLTANTVGHQLLHLKWLSCSLIVAAGALPAYQGQCGRVIAGFRPRKSKHRR